MIKKLLLCSIFLMSIGAIKAQTLSNAQWVGQVAESDMDFSVSFDFTGITADNSMEWQVKTANASGGVDFGSPTIAFGADIAFDNVGSGSQTVTLNLGSGGGSPTITDGQEIIWFGKLNDSNGEVMTLTSPVIIVGSSSGSPMLSNALWTSEIESSDTQFSVSFDFSDITADNSMEWQVKTANASGGVDFDSPTIAFGSDIAFDNIGSGSQTVTLNLGSGGGSPTLSTGQEIIWFGKLNDSDGEVMTLTSNIVIVDESLSLEDLNSRNKIVAYPNPVSDILYIKSQHLNTDTFSIVDSLGRTIRTFNNVQNIDSINLSNLNTGIYILKTNTNKQLRFVKN